MPNAQQGAPDFIPDAAPDFIPDAAPRTRFEQERDPKNQPGFWSQYGSNLKSMIGGMLEGPSTPFDPAFAIRAGIQTSQDVVARKQEGRSPIYNTASTLASLAGIPTRPMEEAANVGNWKGVLAGAAAPATVAAAPFAAEGVVRGTKGAVGGTIGRVKAAGAWKAGAMVKIEDMLHAGGTALGEHFDKAVTRARAEVADTAQRLSTTVDQANPQGAINATGVRASIAKAYEEIVKAPEKYPPALQSTFQDLLTTAEQKPGQWTFEQAKQLRTKVGGAMMKAGGPVKAALTSSYGDLTNQLRSVAEEHGMLAEWKHYNELNTKLQGMLDGPLGSVIEAGQSGRDVIKALVKDKAVTRELTKNLSRFGLDTATVNDFLKLAEKGENAVSKGLIRHWPAAIIGGYLARLLGLGWVEGALVGGYGTTIRDFSTVIGKAETTPLAVRGKQIIKGRQVPGAIRPSEPTLPEQPAAPQARPAPSPATSALARGTSTQQADVPLNLQPGPGENPVMDMLKSILEETKDPVERQQLFETMQREMKKSAERTLQRHRTAAAMAQYKKR